MDMWEVGGFYDCACVRIPRVSCVGSMTCFSGSTETQVAQKLLAASCGANVSRGMG